MMKQANPSRYCWLKTAQGARLTQEAFREGRVLNNMHIVGDGEEAMAFLRNEGKYAKAPIPDIILLDLNMPKKDGRETLAEIKADENLKYIPVVIMTISKSDEDIFRSYYHHANCYITKPINIDEFLKVVKSIEDFWFTIVKLPRRQ